MNETSHSIRTWADAAFGEVSDPVDLVKRAREELAELEEAIVANESSREIVAEAADVMILLHRLADINGHDLSQAVDAKMAINRQRKWVRSGDGTGRHVK
ncbi:DUF550 domain-containing protein [Rhodobacteraceae bacterium RKSG542]|uniref:dATP/dGTP pyrophosphohydrolase domain-containing protein n=1 Tax=Pseudovibrio flavus TaxID=2529854 RepID=UPI0012BC14D0|nr:dATP/dGTP pyrophosphohydrolase domain-containing protein [Pseudovibrio flavus]MTI17364.1 DUF550 domain-containing protein [Pseudovibrio flavus]